MWLGMTTPASIIFSHTDLQHILPLQQGSPKVGAECCLATQELYKYVALGCREERIVEQKSD